jgi:hypothetical protein
METPIPAPNLLKTLLNALRDPRVLDTHPWQYARFLQLYLQEHPEATSQPPGTQLALAVGALFQDFMPASPPRRKKRIDTRWAEFGILAANYFAPFLFGLPYPRSLRDSWDLIDAAILQFALPAGQEASPGQRAEYLLVENEPEPAANSTLSDWHRNGLERFAQFIMEREQSLQLNAPPAPPPPSKKTFRPARLVLPLVLVLLLGLLGLGGYKAWRINTIARALLGDLQAARQFQPSLEDPAALLQAGPLIKSLRANLLALDAEVRPYLWLAPRLAWLPEYGGELANAEPLLDFALALGEAAEPLYQAGEPLLLALSSPTPPGLDALISTLEQASPHIESALSALERAEAARQRIEASQLSPQLRRLLLEQYDPNIGPLRQALRAARALPAALGAQGPAKTYLIILQNEDELRPTGGFLTSVGLLTAENGQIRTSGFEDSYAVDDPAQTYPAAPWQLNQYMDSQVLLLRDANWFSDFPKTVEWIEYLYAYTRAPALDGVIALDQYAVAQILAATGPVQVAGVAEPISAENLVPFMRASKTPPPGVNYEEWQRKDFIGKLADPLFEKILSARGFRWQALFQTGQALLAQKHILLQLDDPDLGAVLASRGWDGRIAPATGDYLMLIDSNVGFSKGNAVISQQAQYRVDLQEILAPASRLTVRHTNQAPNQAPCDINLRFDFKAYPALEAEFYYPISRCYIDYLRVYTPAGTKLTASQAHPVPGSWLVTGLDVPAKVDLLDENIRGIQAFGTLLGVPTGQTLTTSFEFALPPSAILKRGNTYLYQLKIQKQPGTLAMPVSIEIVLPAAARNIRPPAGALIEGHTLRLELKLLEDTSLQVLFDLAP